MIIEKIKQFLRDLDFFILIPVLLLCLWGVFTIYSATHALDEEKQLNLTKQISFLGMGLIGMILLILIPVRLIDSASVGLYVIALVLLIILMGLGAVRYGAQRWFSFGIFSFQPSELAKVAVILFTARILALQRVRPAHVGNIAIAGAIAAVPIFFIIKQPDLGTAISIASIPLPILYRHGISLFSIFVMFSPAATFLLYVGSGYQFHVFILTLIVIAIILFFSRRRPWIILSVLLLNLIVGLSAEPFWDSLKDYQKERILNFIEPERDLQGAGYQVQQSQIAIGNGGITGKGFLEGTQTRLKFLPEQYTDFIFSAIGEEFGFVGTLVLLLLFGIIIFRLLLLSSAITDKFANLTLVGIASLLAFQVFINIGMTAGIMPVTGIPLPFISYGGTALLTNLSLIAIALNISMRKKRYEIH